MHSALAAGERVEVEPSSIADGLNAPLRGPERLAIVQEHVEKVVLVTEEEIARGFASCTSARSSRVSPRAQPPSPPCSPERSRAAERLHRLGRERRRRNGRWYPGQPMKTDIHPDYVLAHVTCSCGNEFWTRSTKEELHVEICAECHPFYTGKQKLVDTGGRVERFQRRLEKAGSRSGSDD